MTSGQTYRSVIAEMAILIFFSAGVLMLICLYHYGTAGISAETTGRSQKQATQMKDVWFICHVRSALDTTVNMLCV